MIIGWIQKYLVYILLGIVALMVVIAGVQYMRVLSMKSDIEKQKGEIKLLDESVKSKDVTIEAYKKNNDAIKKTQQVQARIADSMAELELRISNMKPTKCLEVEDEKVFTDITDAYNNRRLPESSD